MPEQDNPISEQSEKLPKPTELTGVFLDKSLPVSTPVKNEKESFQAPAAEPQSTHEEKFSFLSFVHEYVWANTLFAEQKAAFVFAADTAFLGYLVSTIPSHVLGLGRLQQGLIITALGSLILSIATVVSIITPRLGGHLKGLIYFGAISTRTSAADYISDVLRANQPQFDAAIAHHIYEIAVICNRKQRRIRWAILFGMIGIVVGMLWLTIHHMAATPSLNSAQDFWSHSTF